MSLLSGMSLSAFLTLFLVLLLRPLARRIGLVDAPDHRKRHQGRVPLVGGIAIFCGCLVSTLSLAIDPPAWRPLFAAGAMMLIVGVLDDIKGVGIRERFMAQSFAILLVALWGEIYLRSLGDLLGLGVIHLGWFAVPFTIFGTVGVMNAFNMIDGMDGLSSGLSLLLFAILGLLANDAGMTGDVALLGVLFAGTLGFFLSNFRFVEQCRALSFLGDSGSLFLGFVIACLLVRYSQGGQALFSPVTALWLFALPLMDTVSIMTHRVRKGRSAFEPDREHLHHIFQRAGLGVRRSVLLILVVQGGLSAVGLLGEHYQVPEYVMFYSFMTLFALYYRAMSRAFVLEKILRLCCGGDSLPIANK
jgi:UDP-GlcNAc:undecaprenyl-phosphate GlcNAc-1-phosphate transferase